MISFFPPNIRGEQQTERFTTRNLGIPKVKFHQSNVNLCSRYNIVRTKLSQKGKVVAERSRWVLTIPMNARFHNKTIRNYPTKFIISYCDVFEKRTTIYDLLSKFRENYFNIPSLAWTESAWTFFIRFQWFLTKSLGLIVVFMKRNAEVTIWNTTTKSDQMCYSNANRNVLLLSLYSFYLLSRHNTFPVRFTVNYKGHLLLTNTVLPSDETKHLRPYIPT